MKKPSQLLAGKNISINCLSHSETSTLPYTIVISFNNSNKPARWVPGLLFFESERFTGNTGNNGAGPATISAAVGLIYPSDYGFALYQNSTSTTCNNTSTKLYQGGYDSCEQYNWLFDGNESWFISSYGNNATQAFRLRSAGSVSIGTVNDTARDIIPVVYLNSNVEIFKGDGSLNNPYIIGQKEKTYY